MRKNRMMRLASVLLVCVLLTTSVISGTFAKYVTDGSSKDSARVAKWGVTVSADYSDLFTRGYKYADTVSTDAEGEASVWAGAEVDVVAPGTSGELADFTVTGTPEVAVAVSYVADLKLTNWEISTGEYCPLVFDVNGQYYFVGQTGIENIAALEAAVEAAIVASAAEYDPNADLSVVANDLAVSWSWAFENGTAAEQTDGKDTEIGNWASKGKAAPTVELEVKCTIEQID